MSKTRIVKTTCSICGPCCEVDAYVEDGKLAGVEGARNTPAQSGGLCAKGAAALQYVYNKERILYPMRRAGEKGEGKFERISWDEAYEMIAENLLRIRESYGARSTVFYAGSQVVPSGAAADGQCLRVAELLYRVQHMLPGCGACLALHIWQWNLRAGYAQCQDADAMEFQPLSFQYAHERHV